MTTHARRVFAASRPRLRLGLLAMLLVPVLLLLQAPVLAAVVPGALITAVSLDALARDTHALNANDAAAVVAHDDLDEQRRVVVATAVPSRHHRVG